MKKFVLPEGVYDALKWLALLGLPALGTLYYGLSDIWGLPNAEKVIGTIVVVDTFLGAVLKLSSNQYYKEQESAADADVDAGVVSFAGEDPDTGLPNIKLTVQRDPRELASKDSVTFKVVKSPLEDPPTSGS